MNFNEKVVIGGKNPVTTFSIFLGKKRVVDSENRDEKLINVVGRSERNFIKESLPKSVSLEEWVLKTTI